MKSSPSLAWLGLVLFACADPALPPPAPEAVSPAEGLNRDAQLVRIRGSFAPRVHTDFSDPEASALDDHFEARLELPGRPAVALEAVSLEPEGDLLARVPAGPPMGTYTLVVRGPDGQEGSLANAYRVVSSAEKVATFSFSSAGPQRAGVPFWVTVTAVDTEGERVGGFDQPVHVSDLGGALSLDTPPFERGQVLVEVQLDRAFAEDVLTAEDAFGHRGNSQPFPVLAGLAASLVVGEVPGELTAGDCVGPIAVELRDARGQPADASAPVSLLSEPAVEAFYADAGCASPMDALALAVPSATGSFYLRIVEAGALALRVRPQTAPGVVRAVRVVAAAPARLVLDTVPLVGRVGDCLSVTAHLEDSWGNPTVAGEPLGFALTSAPDLAAFAEDEACAIEVTEVTVDAGVSNTGFRLKPLADGVATVELLPEGSLLGDSFVIHITRF